MSEDDEIVQAFLEESWENLDQLDGDLVALESRPDDPVPLARVFRTIHTVKGTCGFLGFDRLEGLTHAGENLLGALRSGDLRLDGDVTTSLLALVDAIRRVLREVDATGSEGDDDHRDLIADLGRHLAASQVAPSPGAVAPSPAPTAATADEVPVAEAVASETSVRVDVATLDKLLDLVGELVLARSQIGNLIVTDEDGALAAPYRQLRLVTAELQQSVMQARLQPVGTVTTKFRRIARDLATALHKNVRVVLEGEEIGVDKAVNEALRDPLLHLVRNAIDHGLETPEERVALGKPPEGTLRIRASHEGGRVRVEVADDGRGIDGDRLVAATVAAGGLTIDEAEELTEAEKLELMFRPGLSTKDEVTSVSGRGVGMDVVRTNLEQVGGKIEVFSQEGVGTAFGINVPLTLAILPALVVWCGGHRYLLPQADVREVVRVEVGDVDGGVHEVNGVRLYRLRGRLLPLVDLRRELGVDAASVDDALLLVVVRSFDHRFGLVIDAVGDTTEVVVKPLTRDVRAIASFGGVAILGDGVPALVLDVAGVGAAAGVREAEGDADVDADVSAGAGEGIDTGRALLLAEARSGESIAFRLEDVRRLEQLPAGSLERLDGSEVVQYDGAIVPVVRISGDRASDNSMLAAVVCTSAAGPVAVIVERIADVVPEPATARSIEGASDEHLVVGGRVTRLVDVDSLLPTGAEAGR